MSDFLFESIFNSNILLFFTIALLYTAISLYHLSTAHRVCITYSYSLVMTLLQVIDSLTAFTSTLVVLFLILEVFTSDKTLISLFSIKRKLMDFTYRLLCEVYGWLYCILLLLQHFLSNQFHSQFATQSFTFLSIVILTAITSRKRFSAKSITEILDTLIKHGGDPVSCIFSKKDQEKLAILIFMEDRDFLLRKEFSHTLSFIHISSRLINKFKKCRTRNFFHLDISLANKYLRGYGTIEMQILRNIGLDFGSFQLSIRRKIFEIMFSNILFNSYIEQLSPNSDARINIKNWILKIYINVVSIKVGKIVYRPKESKTTFYQLFNKEFSNLSSEEFFVWCLGLRHYKNGVGNKAIALHEETIKKFRLDIEEIKRAVNVAKLTA